MLNRCKLLLYPKTKRLSSFNSLCEWRIIQICNALRYTIFPTDHFLRSSLRVTISAYTFVINLRRHKLISQFFKYPHWYLIINTVIKTFIENLHLSAITKLSRDSSKLVNHVKSLPSKRLLIRSTALIDCQTDLPKWNFKIYIGLH